MNYIGGIDGMNFTPIAGYNNYLKNNQAFEVDAGADFENILKSQTNALKQGPTGNTINSGISMNMNFNELMSQNSSNHSSKNDSAAKFLNSVGSSIGGGLNSVNNSAVAAEKAQEALAMGEDISVHDVMIAAEKSSLSMQMAIQLRNKLMTAYTEINNVRV